MDKVATLAASHFGQRILQLAGESGLSLAEIARRADIPYRTLRNWIASKKRPRGGTDRIRRLEAVLGASLIEQKADAPMVMRERAGPYPGRHYVQPIDFKKRALDHIGRARHVIAHVLDLAEEGHDFTTVELDESLVAMDNELAAAQRELMGKIKINDKGEKV